MLLDEAPGGESGHKRLVRWRVLTFSCVRNISTNRVLFDTIRP